MVTEEHGVIAMHALEGAEPWFKDRVTLPVINGFASAWVDPTFIECCAPGSLFAQHAHVEGFCGWIGAEVRSTDGRVWVEVQLHPPPLQTVLATVSIAGLHRDFSSKRLPLCTREQFVKNNAFYAQAHAA